jgi:RHS repeat-associated protein
MKKFKLRKSLRNSFPPALTLALLFWQVASVAGVPIGLTPLAVTPGSPAGSYRLSNFENINLYNGQLGFSLPLLSIGGRGKVGYTMMLAINKRLMVYNTAIDRCDGGLCESGCTSGSCGSYFLKYIGLPLGAYYAPYLSPGRLWGNREGTFLRNPTTNSTNYVSSLSRFVFSLPDGTELELRDKDTNGKVYEAGAEAPTGFARGTEFVTADGSAATFVSDTPVVDLRPGNVSPPVPYCNTYDCHTMTTPSGYLLLADGTRYEISQGEVTRMLDSNGNYITFTYTTYPITTPTGPSSFRGLSLITDPLGREVSISYAVFTGNSYDEISFKGAGDVPKHVRLFRSGSGTGPVAAPDSVELPNGKSYTFTFDNWGELSRVDLPTGGAHEYSYSGGIEGGNVDGYYGGSFSDPNSGVETYFYRRIVARRVYQGGQLRNITTYSKSDTASTTFPYAAPLPHIEVNQYAATTPDCLVSATCQLLSRERHFFRYSGAQSYSGSTQQTLFKFSRYPRWDEGKEIKTQYFAADASTLLRQDEFSWSQEHVSWWTGPNMVASNEPPNNARLVETISSLPEANKVMKTSAINPETGVVGFDQYNNQTDAWIYDYGDGGPGAILRHVHTAFVNDSNYTSATTGSHLRRLDSGQQLYAVAPDGTETPVAKSQTTYDEGMVDNYGPIGGWMDPGLRPRGNATTLSAWRDHSGTDPDVTDTWLDTHAVYDQCGNVTSNTDALGGQTFKSYLDSFSDGNNGRNTFAFATTTTSADPDGTGPLSAMSSSNEYDFSIGAVTKTTDANGHTITFNYNDPLDRLKQVVRSADDPSLRNQSTYVYDDNSRSVTVTSDLNAYDDNLIKFSTFYDDLGRPTETRAYETSTEYIANKQECDSLGRVSRIYSQYRTTNDETYGWIDTTYDALSRVTKVQTFDRAGTSLGYIETKYHGLLTLVTDQAGKQRLSRANALGNLTDIWEITADPPAVAVSFGSQQLTGYLTHYDYDGLGALTRVTQGDQSPRTFLYNSLKQLLSATNPENGRVTYDYDSNGNLKHKTDARLVTTTHLYDTLNRLVSRSYSDNTPSVAYGYDVGIANSKGRLVSVSSSASNYVSGGYDSLGHITSETQNTDGTSYTLSYGYNRAGAVTSETYPSGRIVKTNYDLAGRIAGVKDEANAGYYVGAASSDAANRIQYSAAGAVKVMRLGNGLWEHTNYNSKLQAVEFGLGSASTNSSVLQLDYGYVAGNNNGNLASQSVHIPGGPILTQTYEYDPLNRLKTAEEANGASQTWKQTYTYDVHGNRYFDTNNTNIPTPLTNLMISPANNRLDRSATGQTLIDYDDAGNLKRDVSGSTYAYDAENRLTSYNGGNPATGGTSYYYDGNGNRVKKVTPTGTTIFVYDFVGKLIAEYNTTQPTTAGTSYFSADHLGTPRVITNGDGAVKARHDYLPFGEEIPAVIGGRDTHGYILDDVRQKFTLKERDIETNADYFGARYYASAQGRFTSPDEPLADQSVDNPQSWNLYSYVRNNPLVMVDPTGRFADFYYSDGTFSYTDHINDHRVYVLDETREADGSINLTPRLLQGVTDTEFRVIANIIRQEGVTTDAREYLWIAHTANNEATANHRTLYGILQTGFSSVRDKTTLLATGNSSVEANASRAGVIDVLAGGADPTGGARRWDGDDFLAWGLHSPNGTPQNKFEEFTTIDIPGATYNSYLRAQQAEFGNSIRFGRTTYTIPAAVFTNNANWVNGNFHYVTGSRTATHGGLTATGTAGRSIFWRF